MAEAIDNPFESAAAPASPSGHEGAIDNPFETAETSQSAVPQTSAAPDSESLFPTTAAGMNKQVEDFIPGVVKGVGQTVHTVSNLINKIPYVGETLAPKAGVDALQTATTPTTTGEKIGAGVEGLGEFFLGDEALKGLSLAEKAGILSKVAKVAESHPTVAKIIGHGLTAVRGGAATAGEELAKGASPKEAAVAGATATGLGAAAGAVTEGIGSKLLASDALKKTAKGVVPEVSSTIHGVLDDVAKTSGLPISSEASASKKALEVSDGLKAQAQVTYKKLDELSGGTYQRFKDTIDGLTDAIKANAHVNPDATEAYRARLIVAKDALNQAENKLILQHGVDPQIIKQANTQWAQAKSLEDVAKKLRSAEMLSGEMKPGTAVLDSGLKNLKPGRLERAVGSGGADTVKQQVIQSGKDIQQAKQDLVAIKNRQKLLLKGAAVAGVGAAAAKAGSLVGALSGH